MGRYKWGYKSPSDISIVTLLITPLIATHEPPSRRQRPLLRLRLLRA